jgi:outer membrane receptor protein involved in Fe transport
MSRTSFEQLGRGLFLSLALVVIAAPAAVAQTSTGSIRGYVTDSSGTPIAGARVIAVNPLTSAQREVATQSNGFYALLGLVPAEYDVTARQIGMAPQKLRVRVLIGEVYPLDFKLGATAIQLEAVTIAAARGVETRTSEVATNVSQQQIERLPTSSRNFLDLAALAPGITVAEDRVNMGAGQFTPRNFSSGGSGPGEVNVFIDGASLKNDLTGGEGSGSGVAGQDASRGNPFPRNAVQEYRVITQNFKAEYQKASSAIITATTKSGSNAWHGNAFFGYQNKDLVALDTFAFKGAKPDYSRYLAGLSAGGPLMKDRLFFFGSYEGNYQNRAQDVTIPVPIAGAFPALDTVQFAKYNGNFPSRFRETLLFGKLTYAINDRSSAELSINNRHETDVRDFGGNLSAQSATNYKNDVTLGTLKHTYSTGPWLNEAAVTYTRFERNPTANTADIVHRWYALPGGCCIEIGSYPSPQDFTQKRIGLRDDVTYTGWHAGGDHVLKMGATTDFLSYDIEKRNTETPFFFFADGVNCNPNCTGNESYGYRVPYQLHWSTGNPFLKANNAQVGAYIQDDWSPTPRLTFNLGIRWDFETHMYNYDYVTPLDARAAIDTSMRTPVTKGDSLVRQLLDTTAYFTNGTQRKKFYGAFQPRVGFSYALDPQGKTTLFGGFGIFYDRSYFDLSVDETLKLTHPEYTIFFADPDSAAIGHIAPGQVAWSNNYLTTDTTVLKSLVASGRAAGKEIWLIGNDVKVPHSTQWNVGLRRMFGNVLVSAAYVGARGYDQLVFNWANITLDANGNCCVGANLGRGFSNVLFSTSSGRTWYDALQVQVNRPYARTENFGWGAGLALTYATRSLEGVDNVDDHFAFTQASLIGKHHPNDEKTRVVANWTLDVPYAYGVQFSGLITLGSGQLVYKGKNRPGGNYVPGGFSPPKYGFIIPGAWRYRSVDLRLRKDFPNISGTSMAVTADLFNSLNFKNYGCYNTGNGNPGCLVTDPRRLQIGAEYGF